MEQELEWPEPVQDDYIAALAVVAALLIVEADSVDPVSCVTEPPWVGLLGWWASKLAYGLMGASLATALAASYAEIQLHRRPPVLVPTLLLVAGALCYVVESEARAVALFGGMRRAAGAEEGLVPEELDGAFLAAALVAVNGALLGSTGLVVYTLRAGTPMRPRAPARYASFAQATGPRGRLLGTR